MIVIPDMSVVKVGTEPDAADEDTLRGSFEVCEKVVEDVESGRFNTKDLQDRIKNAISRLETLTRDVSSLNMYSDNEFIEELPSSSVQLLLIPCYLAICQHNLMTEPDFRVDQLKLAKVYYMDYLKRLRDYEVITFQLPWSTDEDDEDDELSLKKITRHSGDALRQEKINRFKYQKELQEAKKRTEIERTRNPDDESLLRELYIIQLRYYAMHALGEIHSIEEELPILEHMMKIRSGQVKEEAPKPRGPSKPPFIITRTAEQKRVFGLGYPAIPTMTVDEWADGMAKSGRWGQAEQPGGGQGQSGHGHKHGDDQDCCSHSHEQPAPPTAADLSDEEKEDDIDPEMLRRKQQNWDEYKDTHRRGWGNMHNKG